MKTDNIHFHCKNNQADSDLVKAIEALPEEGMGVAFFRNAVQYIRNHLL